MQFKLSLFKKSIVFVPLEDADLPECLKRVQELTGKIVTFYLVDLRDLEKTREIFSKVSFSAFHICEFFIFYHEAIDFIQKLNED